MKKLLSIIVVFTIILFGSIRCYAEEIQLTPKEEVIKQILQDGYSYTAHGLFTAISDGNINEVNKFLMTGTSPNMTYCKCPAIFWAINKKQPKIVEQLIKAGVDPNSEYSGTTLLAYAIKHKNLEIVNVLIRLGANVNKESNGITPLNYALKSKNTAIVNKIISAGANVDEKSLARALKVKDSEAKNVVLAAYKKQ